MHSLGAMVQNVVLLAKMQKIVVFGPGPAGKNFFLLFLSKTFSLGLFRNFLDHAILDPRHHPQKVPVPPGSSQCSTTSGSVKRL